MNDRPIIFSAPMVRAIREGRKTETRRLLTPGTTRFNGDTWPKWAKGETWAWDKAWVDPGPSPAGNPGPYLKLPYGGSDEDWVGTVHRIYPIYWPELQLWVRESWLSWRWNNDLKPSEMAARWAGDDPRKYVGYPANDDIRRDGIEMDGRARPSIHMPRWASRITLAVTQVRVERLQQIDEAGARDEGIEQMKSGRGYYDPTQSHAAVRFGCYFDRAVNAYATLWDTLHGTGAWDMNPWVAVIGFSAELRNIDARAA